MIDISQITDTLQSMPGVLRALLEPFDEATLAERPAEGEWCGMAEIASFDAWEAINARDFATQSLDELLDELAEERATSAELLRGLNPGDLATSAAFHDGRRFEANDLVHEWPFHDQDHLQQILAALKLRYLPHMSPTMRGALTE
jgi:hypothetical protein